MKKYQLSILLFPLFILLSCSGSDSDDSVALDVDPNAIPGFVEGTAYEVSSMIKTSDASAYTAGDRSYQGMGNREIFDRRIGVFTTESVFLVEMTFEDGHTIEAQVHNEFVNSANALVEVDKYAPIIGQLPRTIRERLNDVTIMKGAEDFGGSNGNILIHIGNTALYESFNALEEIILHEAVHATFDTQIYSDNNWVVRQNADNNFISVYAKENPTREDVAESFVAYMAVKARSNFVDDDTLAIINTIMPNRIDYFDDLNIDFRPLD